MSWVGPRTQGREGLIVGLGNVGTEEVVHGLSLER